MSSPELTRSALNLLIDRDWALKQPNVIPYLTQKEQVTRLHVGSRTVYTWECFPEDQLILGDNKQISEYAPGDTIIGPGGEAEVKQTFVHPFDGDLIEIKGMGLLSVRTTPSHPFMVLSGAHRRQIQGLSHRTLVGGDVMWKTAGNLDSDDFLLMPELEGTRNDTAIDLRRFQPVLGWKRGNKPAGPEIIPLNEDVAWLLGIYVAEGSQHSDIGSAVDFSFGKHEKQIIEKTKAILASIGFTPKITMKRTAANIRVNSVRLARALAKLCGGHSTEKMIPDIILLHKNRRIIGGFIDGYTTGDGHRGHDDTSEYVEFSTVSRLLALQLQLLLARFGILASIREIVPGETTIEGRKVKESRNYVVQYYMQARHRRYFIRDGRIAIPITSISHVPFKGNVYNLEADGHTYLASNVIVHNCPLGDDKQFTSLDLTQLKNFILRHKIAHVNKRTREKKAEEMARLKANQQGKAAQAPPQRMPQRRPSVWVVGSRRLGY